MMTLPWSDDRKLWTVAEYAGYYRVHVQTVYAAIRRGSLRHGVERIGRQIRISVPRESINALTPSSYFGEALNDRSDAGKR